MHNGLNMESSEWTSIVNSPEMKQANSYAVTLNEVKMSAQAGQSGVVNKPSVESMVHDNDVQQVKRRKRHISNNTPEAAKKSTKPVTTSTILKLPHRAVFTRKFLASL
jgi:hypothetical protein